jgi:hypothetical protein
MIDEGRLAAALSMHRQRSGEFDTQGCWVSDCGALGAALRSRVSSV